MISKASLEIWFQIKQRKESVFGSFYVILIFVLFQNCSTVTDQHSSSVHSEASPSISNVSINSDSITIEGNNLNEANSVWVQTSEGSTDLSISENDQSHIVVRPNGSLQFFANAAFRIFVQTANAQVSGTISINNGPTSCPDGMVLSKSGGSRPSNFCIDKSASAEKAIASAQMTCYGRGGSLCFANEWAAACTSKEALGISDISLQAEWLAGADSLGGSVPTNEGFNNISGLGTNTGSSVPSYYQLYASSGGCANLAGVGSVGVMGGAFQNGGAKVFRCCRR